MGPHPVDHLRLKRRSHLPSTLKIVERMNEVDTYLRRRFEETLMGGVGEVERVMLRDALLEGFVLGMAWTVGKSDSLEDLLQEKDDIGLGMSQSGRIHGQT